MVKANIISGLSQGLINDSYVLKSALESIGVSSDIKTKKRHSLNPIKRYPLLFEKIANKITNRRKINFHIEHIYAGWRNEACLNIWIPNHEEYYEEIDNNLHMINYIVCKTIVGYEALSKLSNNCLYTGFSSPDRYKEVPNKSYRKFLHVMGTSHRKGTKTLLQLWSKHQEWPKLHVVFRKTEWNHAEWVNSYANDNIDIIEGPVSDEKLSHLQNTCGIHLCPSEVEGFGHYIVEALSTHAVVITTNAGPMNEHIDPSHGYLVDYKDSEPCHHGTKYYVDELSLERTIEKILDTKEEQLIDMGRLALKKYKSIQLNFTNNLRANMKQILGDQ